MRVLILLVLILSLLASCRTQKNTIYNYLENIPDTTIKDLALKQAVIQKGDLLSVRVFSAALGTAPEADAPYNLPEQAGALGTTGFLVDENGNIEYPQLGTIRVEGLTKEQLAEQIKGKLEGQLTNPSVTVRFLNYKVTVLGEVRNPSSFTVPTDRVTVLEALGMAGDITEFGRKDTIKVIREMNGQVEIGSLALTSKDMFTSPYFRLQQNDVVYVEQTRRKVQQQEQQTLAQQITIASSIITALALILNLIR